MPQGDRNASEEPDAGQTTTMRGAAFRPEYVQWSLRHRNLRRTSGVPLNNIFWYAMRALYTVVSSNKAEVLSVCSYPY